LRHSVLQQRLPGQQHHPGLERPRLSRQVEGSAAVLHSTNNFPDFTGRICPAPCEAACTLNINNEAVGIKSIEHAIVDKGWQMGWIVPQPPKSKTGKKVAVVGSGPAGLAAAQQLARVGHDVTVFEKNGRPGGLLGYGIPDFKLDKSLIERRVKQMQAEGVTFRNRVIVGSKELPAGIVCDAKDFVSAEQLQSEFDAVILATGSEVPRDLPIPGPRAEGRLSGAAVPDSAEQAGERRQGQPDHAKGKHVIVIGGGDTGSDCVGTSYRHGAASVTQFELMPQPPEQEDKPLTWPYWPLKMRTSSSHLEGDTQRVFSIATKEFIGEKGVLKALKTVELEWKDGKMSEVAGSEKVIPADLVFLAMGFVSPVGGCSKPSASRRMRAAMPRRRPTAKDATQRVRPRCLPPATRGAGSRWSSGRSAKAASVRVKSMPS
jgi:glutamate synthase (NADPH/NADH) small chain